MVELEHGTSEVGPIVVAPPLELAKEMVGMAMRLDRFA